MTPPIENERWYRLVGRGYNLFKTSMTALFLLMIFIAVLGILARQIEGVRLLWTSTVASALLIVVIFLGAAIAEIEGEHIQIQFFSARIIQRVPSFEYAIDIVTILFSTIIVVSASGLTVRYWGTHWADLLWLPTGLLYLSIAVGFGMITLHRVRGLINALQGGNNEV
jgi:TRAP-type C4-dicarboxylate transport system permease small subunit